MGLHNIRLGDLIDCVFPMLEQKSAKAKIEHKARLDAVRAEEESLVAGLPSNEAHLKEHLESVEKLVEKEQSRRTSVDARLMSIVGLTSIAATVVLTALFAMAAGTMPLPQDVSKWTLVLGCFYLALQLFAALYAAVKGLSRASYSSETAADLLPPPQLTRSNFLRRCISNKFDLLKQHQDVNNEKVSQMAVSHRAVLNFLVALVILAGAASLMALNREPPKEGGVCGAMLSNLCAAHDGALQATPPAPFSKTEPRGDGFKSNDLILPYLALTVGVVLLVAGLFLLSGNTRRPIVAAVTISGLLLSLLGGSKLELVGLKFDKLIGKLELRISEPPVISPKKIVLTKIVTVEPFPPGEHKFNQDAVLSCVREALKPYSDLQISGWQIIGRVDKRPLRAGSAAIYGSNQTLAMARAVWVRDNVLSRLKLFNSGAAVVSVGGARNIGAKVGDPDLQLDRAVDVYVLLDQEAPQTSSTKLPAEPTSVACPKQAVKLD